MLVVKFNGVDMTLHDGGRGALEREARGTGGNTEIGNLTIGNIVYEACVWSNEGARNLAGEGRTMDEHRMERSALAVVRPLLMGSGAAAALLFQVESVPVLGGPG